MEALSGSQLAAWSDAYERYRAAVEELRWTIHDPNSHRAAWQRVKELQDHLEQLSPWMREAR